MNKKYISMKEHQKLVANICRDIALSNWRPDYIVGITRGGLISAVMISHYLNVPMYSLKVALRDHKEDCESNLWMAEDAFGYVETSDRAEATNVSNPSQRKNILIVDDINDSGATLKWIKKDWESSCLPKSPVWNHVWGQNVRIATLVNNQASHFKDVDYTGIEINKNDEPFWIVFPSENFWN